MYINIYVINEIVYFLIEYLRFLLYYDIIYYLYYFYYIILFGYFSIKLL